jgi:hypothetical protein
VSLCLFFWGASFEVPLPLLLYPKGGRGYKEGNRVSYNVIPIRTLSLFAYFTYISIYIIIYALESTSWSSEITWMVAQVIMDPSLGHAIPYEVVPWVLIIIRNVAQVLPKVHAAQSSSHRSV